MFPLIFVVSSQVIYRRWLANIGNEWLGKTFRYCPIRGIFSWTKLSHVISWNSRFWALGLCHSSIGPFHSQFYISYRYHCQTFRSHSLLCYEKEREREKVTFQRVASTKVGGTHRRQKSSEANSIELESLYSFCVHFSLLLHSAFPRQQINSATWIHFFFAIIKFEWSIQNGANTDSPMSILFSRFFFSLVFLPFLFDYIICSLFDSVARDRPCVHISLVITNWNIWGSALLSTNDMENIHNQF